MKNVNLSDLGTDKASTIVAKDAVQDVILEWGNALIDDFRQRLLKNNSFATGQLYGQIEPEIKVNTQGTKFVVYMLDYYRAVEFGQKPGVNVTQKTILQWMKNKRTFKLPSTPTMQNVVAKIITRHIVERGTKARPFIAPILTNSRIQTLSDSVAKAFAENIFTK